MSVQGIEIYGSASAERLGAAIYHYRSAERDGGARLTVAWDRLKIATKECTQQERERVLQLVGPQTMATLPKVD